MTVEAQRCVGPQEKPRIGSGVAEASFQEWCYLRERMLETVRRVKSRATGAQTELAVADRSGTGQHGSVAQSRIQKLPAEGTHGLPIPLPEVAPVVKIDAFTK